jgi:CheY-like chemotaxis protein/HPt (histidine-containing phosphotransfer) domain-containing protein
LVIVDQQHGFGVLEEVAAVSRRASGGRDIRLCVLVPPGPIDAWHIDGPANTSYVSKPASRRKLCAVIAGTEESRGEGVVGVRPGAPRGLGHRILLVEDNEANRDYARRVLENAGHTLEIAEDGLEGLRMATERSYDLILTDLEMPRMDGFEMTREILERRGSDTPPILAFTAHVVQGFKERCLQAGMAGYVAKPVRPEDLLTAVADAMPSGPLVLLVDDSSDNLELARRFLEDQPLTIETADNGRAAIDRVREGGISCVVLDMNMPGLDGYETARRMRALYEASDLPILAMTSWTGAEEERRCLEAGCDAYLEKPLRRGKLVEALGSLLDREAAPQAPTPNTEAELTAVDPSIADLIPEYLDGCRETVAALRDHLRRSDLEAIRIQAHNLAGSGAPYGFPRISELGRTLEAVAAEGGREEVTAWLNELETYIATLRIGKDPA